ncbi:unnamed protein product [Microthlaspi erraticum]|uniref:Aspartic peptidase DDI1-type domain-containing protein n=1 Tax=Microthlaspi erraticum TaxID=1685480 RepID=A0A6D2HVS0_9BRAS|nr:unnamed protein product [Microthlaspi erraticum]
MQLVENIANSNGSYGEEYDRTNRSSTHHSIESDEKLRKEVKSLNEKLDKLMCLLKRWNQSKKGRIHNLLKTRSTLNNSKLDRVKPHNMGMVKKELPRPSRDFSWSANAHTTWLSPPTTPACTYTENELKAMLKQLLQGQADGVVDTSKKLAEINSKIENLNTRVYSLENHASSVAAATKQGQLPGKAIQNPKEQCKVIFTQEGLDEEEDQEDLHTSPVELAQQARSAARSSRTLARSSQTSSVLKPILLDPYQPVDPSFRLLSQGHKEVIHKFRRDLSEIGIELPSMESMSEAFEQMKMIQDVMANKDKVSELLEMSAYLTHYFLPKVKDQGKFTLPCTLGHIELDNALVDSGASINLISLTMAEKLGIAGALQRPTTSIMFGDATSKSPLGVFKNYHLKIGECIIQTDLTVMEMEEEKDLPCYWEPLSLAQLALQ